MKLFKLFVALGGVSLLVACGGGGGDCKLGALACGSSGGASGGAAAGGAGGGVVNVAPVAHAGSHQTVVTDTEVTLNGSASSDANDDKLTYLWSLVSAPAGFNLSPNEVKPENATAVKPTFKPTVSGAYVFGLVVTDSKNLSSPREVVTVTASPENLAPIARAGNDQSVTINTPVTLDGSASSDPNRDVLTHAWTWVSQPVGSAVTFDSATSAKPKFTPVLDGAYVASLVVRDGSLNSEQDFVTVTVSKVNAPPVASAGPDQNVITGATVTLNGTGSTDANGDAMTYRWTLSRPSGSAATLLLTVPERPTFVADVSGDYVASLIVNDLKADSLALSTVRVTAAVANLAPTASAVAARSTVSLAALAADKLVTLDGTGSADANFDRLTYTWTLTTVPTGNTATLTVDPASAAKSTFTPNVVGVYVATLLVSDSKVNSAPATVAITVTP